MIAEAQADSLTAGALERPCTVKSRLSQRGTIAHPAPRALGVDGNALISRLDLRGSWFESVEAEGGFLNFTLSERWYEEAVRETVIPVRLSRAYPPPPAFPAKIEPFDWAFLWALRGKMPDPSLAARQDGENPGWLLRYTVKRLQGLEKRSSPVCVWTEEERRLMRLAADAPLDSVGDKRKALYLTALTREIWTVKPEHIPQPLNRVLQTTLYKKFTQNPNK